MTMQTEALSERDLTTPDSRSIVANKIIWRLVVFYYQEWRERLSPSSVTGALAQKMAFDAFSEKRLLGGK